MREIKLFIIVNVDWFFLSHRLPIAKAAQDAGYDVTIVTANTGKLGEIERQGLKVIDAPFSRSGTSLISELGTFRFLYKLFKRGKPDLVHLVTIKPNIYGSLAATFFKRIKVINAISGMGYNFSEGRKGVLQRFIRMLMKIAYKREQVNFIFQNKADQADFINMGLTDLKHCIRIKGSGVDLDEFKFYAAEETDVDDKVTFVFPARMLYDKGVATLVDAARVLKDRLKGKAKILLAGALDPGNKTGVPENELLAMQEPGYIEWIGFQKGMRTVLKNCQVVVLPTYYREGVPKALIEACAIGRPIITTDMPGCKECVSDGFNGYLVKQKNVDDLAEKMLWLFNDAAMRKQMGVNSRKIAEENFSIRSVVDSTLNLYADVLNS
ncbi:MAG TPA: glycosyltransferase family 4 protein [Mucilaginibacter sp.]|nr:glycosyltransferase family 4 protein [Mucilaginibacter sp.]